MKTGNLARVSWVQMRSILKSPAFIASLIAVLLWIPMLTSVVETLYWSVRYRVSNPAPSDYVVVSLDRDNGFQSSGLLTSTAAQAKLLKQIAAAHPAQIFFDFPSAQGRDPAADRTLYAAAAKTGVPVSFVLRTTYNAGDNKGTIGTPDLDAVGPVPVVVSNWRLNSFGIANWAPTAANVADRALPNIATAYVHGDIGSGRVFGDFSVDPTSIMTLDADRIADGAVSPGVLAGKVVFVTTTQASQPTSVAYYAAGRQPAVAADIAAIVAAKKGQLRQVTVIAWVVLFAAMVCLGRRARKPNLKYAIYGSLMALLLLGPAWLASQNVFTSSEVGLVAVAIYIPLRIWQKRRARDRLTNLTSGLPTIEALALDGFRSGVDVVAVVVSQYEHMLSSLPRDLHGECARQIARRLAVASDISEIHATENGYFVWLEAPCTLKAQVSQLEGLKALFASPLVIGGHTFDTNVHFGLDRNGSDDPMSRIQAALAAAGEAQIKGKLYEEFEQKRRQQSPWELSLHARIDEGLRNGDIWLAFQPQLDIRSGEVTGAEALIRWNDPERGVIPPDAFIIQAERAGRIEAITYWVLEGAIEASAELRRIGAPLHLSVNLSARMVDHPGLLPRVREVVSRHRFDCRMMTFEVTETFSMGNRSQALANLSGLRDMGFRLSIDDFGTGHASLAYLAEMPSDEIKLDKQFIQKIGSDRRERVIVRSVIRLAHALGHVVCAEGIEDEHTLLLLRQMNCDLAQGYHIGIPQRLEALIPALLERRGERRMFG